MRTLAIVISKSVGILLALFPVTGLAHTLEAPDTVMAAADGSFSYESVFTVGPASALIAGSGWEGIQNVPYQQHGDCFPCCTSENGQVSVLVVTSTLGVSTLPGQVRRWVAFCDEPDLEVVTTIMPDLTVPVKPTTWGAVKALYAIESLYERR